MSSQIGKAVFELCVSLQGDTTKQLTEVERDALMQLVAAARRIDGPYWAVDADKARRGDDGE